MPIDFPINRTVRRIQAGDDTRAYHHAYESTPVIPKFIKTTPISYDIPVYNLSGASFNYYEQNIHTISTSLNNVKEVEFYWTSNLHVLSGASILQHRIHRLENDLYTKLLEAPLSGTGLTQNFYVSQIEEIFEEPLIIIDEHASATTWTTPYTLKLPEIIKPTGQFTQKLFSDKAQYFIDTRLIFTRSGDTTIGDFVYPNPIDTDDLDFILNTGQTSATTIVTAITNSDEDITGILNSNAGQFLPTLSEGVTGNIVSAVTPSLTGVGINGAYFVYFVVPNKPDIYVLDDAPMVQGTLTTYSPTFGFNNVDDGDFYRLQVNYDTTDFSFSGAQTALFKIPQQEGDPEFIRLYSTPLTPSENFIYRIGNTKEIVNIFGAKQNVTAWSNIASAVTTNDGTYNVSGTVFQTYLYSGPHVTGATVEFLVVANTSAVDVGADLPSDSGILGEELRGLAGGIGATFSALTNVNGYYEIDDMPGGYIKVTMTHPIFGSATQFVTIDQNNQDKDFTLTIFWGDQGLQFGDFDDYLFI